MSFRKILGFLGLTGGAILIANKSNASLPNPNTGIKMPVFIDQPPSKFRFQNDVYASGGAYAAGLKVKIANAGDINYSYNLGGGITIGMLSKNAAISKYEIVARADLTADDIMYNMESLVQKVLLPIKEHFGNFTITSGFRAKSTLAGKISQHEKGQACDIQFSGWSRADYVKNAEWVKNNINFDQFIIEKSSSSAWWHFSYDRDLLPLLQRNEVLTMIPSNGKNVYYSGIKSLT